MPSWREIGQRLGLFTRSHALTPISDTLRRKSHELAERRVADNLTRATGNTNGTAGWTIVRGQQPSDFQNSGAEVRKLGWERHPVVNACGRVIVELIKSIPLEVYRKRADGTALVQSTSPALDLLQAPRTGMSGARMIGRIAMQFFLYGNAFLVIERNGRRGIPRGLRVVPAEDVQFVWLKTDDTIASYDWRDLQGAVHSREPVENMVHFRDLDGTDGLFGYPRLASALLDIAADTEASQYVRQIVVNNGMPGAVVSVDGAPTQGDLEAGEQRWREKYAVRGMRGMTAFMAGIKDLIPIGFNLQQLEFPDLRRVTREDICAAANVDPRMISVASAANDGGLSGVQFREARHRLIQQTVYPIMRAIEDELNYWYMPEYGESLVRFSEEYIAAITEDVTATSTRVVAEVAAKVRTVEEAREAIGLDAEMDPTHTLPGGMTVGDTQANATAMSAALLKAAENPAPVAGSNGTAPNKAPATRIRASLALTRAFSPDDEEQLRIMFLRAALLLFAAERADVLRILTAVAAGEAVATDPIVSETVRRVTADYAPTGQFARAWTAKVEPLIGRAVRTGGGDIAAGVNLDFSGENPRVRGIVARRTADLVTSVTETTRESIRAALMAGRQQGLGIRQIAQLIDEATFGEISGNRAKMIAQTETVGALNSGEYAAAVQSGVMRSKTWVANLDDRVRDSHRALNGVTRDIGASFPNGLRYPHDPLGAAAEVIGCRCSLTFSDLEAGTQ